MNKAVLFITVIIFLFPASASAYRSKLLQITAYGSGADTVNFTGWCDIDIGNNSLHRTFFEGQDKEMPPIQVHGRYIDSCELRNLSEKGTISLILHQSSREFYKRTSKKDEHVITYGPTMKRYSTRPYPFNQAPEQQSPGQKDE